MNEVIFGKAPKDGGLVAGGANRVIIDLEGVRLV